jgi:hypothetical protein
MRVIPALADASFEGKRPGAFPVCLDTTHEPIIHNRHGTFAVPVNLHPNNGFKFLEWGCGGIRYMRKTTA